MNDPFGLVNHEKLRALELALKLLSCPGARIDIRVSGDAAHTAEAAISVAEKFLDWSRK